MARLNAAKIVDSDSDSDLPEMSTIFSAKSIATPKKNLIPRPSSIARDDASVLSTRKPRRRVLGKATDNVLLRPLGKDSPAPEFEGRRKRAPVLNKTLFDEEDEQPRARREASRPRVALRRKIQDIAREEVDESEEEVESTYVRPRVVKKAPVPRTVQASAREEAVRTKHKATRDVLEDFGNLTIQGQSEEDEPVVQSRTGRSTRVSRKPSPPKYVEPDSSEPDDFEEQEEEPTQSESEKQPASKPRSPDRTRSIPMVIIPAYKPLASENGDSEEELDILEASCLEDDLEHEAEPLSVAAPRTVPRPVPQARLPSNIFNALQHLPPPKAPTSAPSDKREDGQEEEEHIDTLEVSCLEDDDEGEVEEGTAEIHEKVYEHQVTEDEDKEDVNDSDDISDFLVSDGEEEISDAPDSEVVPSEDESFVKPAPQSVRRLVKGRKKATPPPPSIDPAVEFHWSEDDDEEEQGPARVKRTLFPERDRTSKSRGLPTLSDSEDEEMTPTLNPHTPSDSDAEPERERTPRSNTKQAEPSKRLNSPTKPKFPRLNVVSPPRRQSNDAFWEPEVINKWHDEYSPQKTLFQSPTKSAKPISRLQLGGKEVVDIDLLKSPTKAQIAKAKKAEKDAAKEWEASKNSVALAFLEELDQKVTAGEVARMSESTGGVEIIWSTKLNTTAGRAHWRREGTCRRATPQEPHPVPTYNHHCSIELATKVIKDTHQLINVLAHEFCHLTTFMISKELKNPHGAEFKSWGRKVEKVFGSRGVEVTTKHSYEIQWKYVWQCQGCRRDVGRHSKSIDTKKMRCGNCRGELVQIKPVPRGGVKIKPSSLFPDAPPRDSDSAFFDGSMREAGRKEAKPKQLSEYQVFVKENMARIKADNPGSPMKEVMGLVGARYRQEKAGRKLFGEDGRLRELKLKTAETDVEAMAKSIEVLDLTSD